MKKLALVFGLVALAACSTSSEDDADSLSAAVKKDYPAPEDRPQPSTEPPPVEVPPDAPVAPAESCASLREKPARGELKVEDLVSDEPIAWADVEATLGEDSAFDGTHTYFVGLELSTVKNRSLYDTFGGHPMDEKFSSFGGSFKTKENVVGPWLFELTGADGTAGSGECRNGEATLGAVLGNFIHNKITITKMDNEFIEGTYERAFWPNYDQVGEVFERGTFRAPITARFASASSAASSGNGFRNKPNKALCCKLQ